MLSPSLPSTTLAPTTVTLRKRRRPYSKFQIAELEREYNNSTYISKSRRWELSQLIIINLSERQIKIWFQNRRIKAKKVQKRDDSPIKTPNSSSCMQQPMSQWKTSLHTWSFIRCLIIVWRRTHKVERAISVVNRNSATIKSEIHWLWKSLHYGRQGHPALQCRPEVTQRGYCKDIQMKTMHENESLKYQVLFHNNLFSKAENLLYIINIINVHVIVYFNVKLMSQL